MQLLNGLPVENQRVSNPEHPADEVVVLRAVFNLCAVAPVFHNSVHDFASVTSCAFVIRRFHLNCNCFLVAIQIYLWGVAISVYKNKKAGKWQCIFRVTDWTGKRKQVKKTGFTRRADALEYERNYLARESGSPDMTFGDLVALYMEDAKARLRPTTYENKLWILERKILPYFREQNVMEITPTKIRKWQTEMLGRGYAPTYLKTINNQLTAVFNYAVRYYSLPHNPATAAGSMGKRDAYDMDYWTLDEFERFIGGLSNDPTAYTAFNLLFWTGMREGELQV